MAQTQITITTEQALDIQDIRDEFAAESDRLVEAAKTAKTRGPGMIAKSESLSARAGVLTALLEQIPVDVIAPPAPPAFETDKVAQLVTEAGVTVYVLGAEGTWSTPGDTTALTTAELVEAGATRLAAIAAAAGEPLPSTESTPQEDEKELEEISDEELADVAEDIDDVDQPVEPAELEHPISEPTEQEFRTLLDELEDEEPAHQE